MKAYQTTTLVYVGFSVLWILLSDLAVEAMMRDPSAISRVQSVKGILFVVVSAVLIHGVARRLHEREVEREREKNELYRDTMGAVQHVVRNFLNQMQIVTLEAEDCEEFDPRTLEIARRTTRYTEDKLTELARIEVLSPGTLRAFVDSTLGRPVEAEWEAR